MIGENLYDYGYYYNRFYLHGNTTVQQHFNWQQHCSAACILSGWRWIMLKWPPKVNQPQHDPNISLVFTYYGAGLSETNLLAKRMFKTRLTTQTKGLHNRVILFAFIPFLSVLMQAHQILYQVSFLAEVLFSITQQILYPTIKKTGEIFSLFLL